MRRAGLHLWVAATIIAGSCRTPVGLVGPGSTGGPATAGGPAPGAPINGGRLTVPIDTKADTGVLTVRAPDAKVVAGGSTVSPLGDADTAALLARLELLPDLTAANVAAPSIRAPSPPPPRPGAIEPIAFVVPSGKAVADAPVVPRAVVAPLVSPQITPEGEVRAESEVRIRFSQPMVAVAAVGVIDSQRAPAKLAPPVAGTWRWIDSRVLQFTAAKRFPQATEVTVTVPAGVRALDGATLAAEARAVFQTPPVAIDHVFPTTVRPDAPLAVAFDQDVDPAAMLRYLHVRGARGRDVAFREIALAEARQLWARDPGVPLDAHLDGALGAHHVIVAPVTSWPAGSDAQVVLAHGAPSREGPRTAKRDDFSTFTIVPAFRALGVACADDDPPRVAGAVCPAKSYLGVVFSNQILESSYRAAKVQIAGEPFVDNSPLGADVALRVPDPVGRAYAIAIGEDLVDAHGQPLVGPRRLSFTTSPQRFLPLVQAPTGLIVLDPRFQIPQWLVSAQAITSLHVELFAVEPKDYFAFRAFELGTRTTPPGRRVVDQTFTVGPRRGAHLRVDLRPALGAAGLGHVVAVASAVGSGRTVAWIEVTKLGVTARSDGDQLSAWVQDIGPARFLAPTPDASVSILVDGRGESAPVVTGADGRATLELLAPARSQRRPGALLAVRTTTDSMFASIEAPYERAIRTRNALWYVTDDRFTYKPGEKVYVKGWVRWTHDGKNPDLALPAESDTIAYTLVDEHKNKIAGGNAPVTDQGGFDIEVELPKNANLGTATFSLATRNGTGSSSYRHPIAIQEFRTPAYSVDLADDVTHSGSRPLILGEAIEMSTTAKYYAGGGLPGAAVQWDARLVPASYRPPGWDLFSFAPAIDHERDGSTEAHSTTGLSAASVSNAVFGVAALADGRPGVLEVDATVTDVDRMHIRATSRPIIVHPSMYYVGIRRRAAGDLELIVTDVDGTLVPGVPIDVSITGVLGSERDRADARIVDTQHCALTSAAAPVLCAWKWRDVQHAYTATARIADPRGRANSARFAIPWWSVDDTRNLAIVPDRQSYRPGDVAKLDLRSKVLPATAIVSFARHGVIAQRRIELAKPSTIVELPIEPAYLGNIHVLVDRTAKRLHMNGAGALPDHDSVQVDLPVDTESARLAMRARPLAPLIEPGERATFEVEVRRDGKPEAGAEVALIVVDEAVLALSSRTFGDPLAPFYHRVDAGASLLESMHLVDDSGPELDEPPGVARYDLDDDEALGFGRSGYGDGAGGAFGGGRYGTIGHGSGVIKSRKDFRANAVFSPRLRTADDGKVRLTVKMPDSLTRFRIVALATSDTRYFGKAESTIVTQRKVNARTVAPRFLSQGDAFSLPVVVQNLDAAPRTIDIAVRAANLAPVGQMGKRVTVPGGQRAEVRFDFTTRQRGKAVIQTVATSGSFADASTVEVPVYEPATTESFATYGTVDDAPQFEQLRVPDDLFRDVGGVEVELASTQLQSLTDAYWYLYAYPYECAEQRSSRMLATAAIYDLLDAFAVPGRPSHAEIDAQLGRDVAQLTKEQRPDGGWGYFGGMKSDPFVSMQVLGALAARGVQGAVRTKAIGFVTKELAALLARLERTVALPDAQRVDRAEHGYVVSLAAAGLATLATTGTDVRPRAERLHAIATELAAYPIDAKARLLAIVSRLPRAQRMRDRLVSDLLSATQETAAGASVTARYEAAEKLLLVSSTKTTALALDALIREVPDHALITKLARGVLDMRHHGRWSSTQDNLAALAALRRYFDRYEKATPDFTGKLWFGAAAYAEQTFAGRSGARGTARVAWTALPAGSAHDLAVVKAGTGRMYYRIGITYAPKRTDLPPLDAGFLVRRSYTAIDDPADVARTPTGWRIRLGARVLVTVEALNTTRRFGVAVVDPLPAGFEAVNESLATSERAVDARGDELWDHIAMRDTRSEAFAMDLAEGSHRFSYTVRAATPGRFVAAPAKAEEMYSPETFGRSAGATVVIE